jgi:hypothetical protein
MAEDGARAFSFEGIDAPNTTPVPDVYFDVLFPQLGKAPLKVLLYLVRRIFGFKKDGDTVSLSQICRGIRRRDGTVLDRGTGLSRHAATAAIRELETMGVIAATRSLSANGDPAATYYDLRFREQLSVQDLLRQGSSAEPGYRFPGIDSPNTTPVPDIYFDLLLPELGLAEWRVLLYVVRRTLGFKKLSDAISLDQFTGGITTHSGARLDAGTGLSRSNVHEALNRLVMRNVLIRQRIRDSQTGDGASIFSLAMREDVRQTMGTAMGMAPGPLLEGTNDSGSRPRVPQADYQGVPQSNHYRVPPENRPGVLLPNHLQQTQFKEGAAGVLELDHPGVSQRNHLESSIGTAGEHGSELPLGRSQTPQQTDSQETALQEGEIALANPYSALVRQVAEDLGMPSMAAIYDGRIAKLAAGCMLPTPDFYEALLTAWRVTRSKLAQRGLTHPSAAMAYFYSVVCERVGHNDDEAANAARPAESHQDAQFVELVRERAGDVGSQQMWQLILQGLSGVMSRANFTRWFSRSVALDAGDALLIVVADTLQRDWLARRLYPVIQREAVACGVHRPFRFLTVQELSP